MIKIKDGFVSSFSKFKELNEGDFFVYDNNIYQKTARFSCFFYKEGAPSAIPTVFSEEFLVKKIKNVNVIIEIIPDESAKTK